MIKNFAVSIGKKAALLIGMALLLTACGENVPESQPTFSDNIQNYLAQYSAELEAYDATYGEDLKAWKEEMMAYYGENKTITGSYDEAAAAKCTNGVFVGKVDEDGIVAWKGVPYAKQPTDSLRWMAPQKAEADDTVYEAQYFGHSAIQCESNDDMSSLYPQGEDCLNIAVWNNKTDAGDKKPVMLYIHGGAYVEGGASEPMYDCTNFVRNHPDVILASVDYRTGILGFINLSEVPGGQAYKESANLGLLDIIEALRWMKENIAAFGGDPENITVFGESAGSGIVSALTIIPQAKGLIRRAIMESGTASRFLRSEEKSIASTKRILDISGAKTMEDLLSLSSDDLRTLMRISFIEAPMDYTYPQCDGIVLPTDIGGAMEDGTRNGIDILIGTNKDEMKYWTFYEGKEAMTSVAEDRLDRIRAAVTDDERERLETFLAPCQDDVLESYERLYNYFAFHTQALYEAKTHAANGQNVYMYYFTEESSYPDLKSAHAFEVRYVFGNLDDLSMSDEPADPVLSAEMQTAWINFAKTGDPSVAPGEIEGCDGLVWERYTAPGYPVMVFNSAGSAMKEDPLNEDNERIKDLKDILN